MEYKQMIQVGRHIQDIFALPCVNAVYKDGNGLPLYEVYAKNAKWAFVGQWLAQDTEDRWWVLDSNRNKKGGSL